MTRHAIEFDSEHFDPRRIIPVTHNLVAEAALSFDALCALARRLPRKQVRFHAITAGAGSDFERAEEEHRHTIGVAEALEHLPTSGSWIALHNVQTDPVYGRLLDQVLGQVDQRISKHDPGMFHRAFWIFIQSPGSVTPFHMDHEQNFLMQIRGKKTARVWYPEQCLSDYAVEVFHSEHHRREAAYREEFNATAQTFSLVPGQGVYMPNTCPHLVHNGDDISITVSMTYCSKATRRAETIARGNHALRRFGLEPRPVGKSPRRDAVKNSTFAAILRVRDWLRGEPHHIPAWARH